MADVSFNIMEPPLQAINQESKADEKSCGLSLSSSERPDSQSSLARSLTDTWGNVHRPQAARTAAPLEKPLEPEIDPEEMEDEELVILMDTLRADLLYYSYEQEALRQERVELTATKQEHIQFQDNQVETWIEIIVDACQL